MSLCQSFRVKFSGELPSIHTTADRWGNLVGDLIVMKGGPIQHEKEPYLLCSALWFLLLFCVLRRIFSWSSNTATWSWPKYRWTPLPLFSKKADQTLSTAFVEKSVEKIEKTFCCLTCADFGHSCPATCFSCFFSCFSTVLLQWRLSLGLRSMTLPFTVRKKSSVRLRQVTGHSQKCDLWSRVCFRPYIDLEMVS